MRESPPAEWVCDSVCACACVCMRVCVHAGVCVCVCVYDCVCAFAVLGVLIRPWKSVCVCLSMCIWLAKFEFVHTYWMRVFLGVTLQAFMRAQLCSCAGRALACVCLCWTSSDHYGKRTLFIVACQDHYQQRAKMDRRKWKPGRRINRSMFCPNIGPTFYPLSPTPA